MEDQKRVMSLNAWTYDRAGRWDLWRVQCCRVMTNTRQACGWRTLNTCRVFSLIRSYSCFLCPKSLLKLSQRIPQHGRQSPPNMSSHCINILFGASRGFGGYFVGLGFGPLQRPPWGDLCRGPLSAQTLILMNLKPRELGRFFVITRHHERVKRSAIRIEIFVSSLISLPGPWIQLLNLTFWTRSFKYETETSERLLVICYWAHRGPW